MICQTCHQELELQTYTDDDGTVYDANHWECPEYHTSVNIIDDKIVGYTLFFEMGRHMYRLVGSETQGWITLFRKPLGEIKSKRRIGYRKVLVLPQFINAVVKDDIIQTEYMMNKIQKLVIFS